MNFFQSVDDQHVNTKVEYDIGIGTAGVIDYTSAKTGIETTETYKNYLRVIWRYLNIY